MFGEQTSTAQDGFLKAIQPLKIKKKNIFLTNGGQRGALKL